MKKHMERVHLYKETLRNLTPRDLRHSAGAAGAASTFSGGCTSQCDPNSKSAQIECNITETCCITQIVA